MKFNITVLAFLTLYGCSNLSPNQHQIKMSLSNLDCYRELVNRINSSEELIENISAIRDSKRRGEFDSVTAKQNFRLIGLNEIIHLVDSSWMDRCRNKLEDK